MSTVSVVLPTLNEADNIVPLIDGIYASIPDVHEVVVVDDDSSDGTGRIVREYASAHPDRLVRLELRTSDHGLTKSIAHGVRAATGDIVVWMDCDLSMPPEVIPQLLRGIAEGYDIACGSRFVRGGSFKRDTTGTQDSALAVALSRGMNYAIQLLLDHSFKDYTSGFIAVRRDVVQDLGLRGDYGEYFIDFIFRAIRAGYVILEVPYVCLPRLHGESKTGTNLLQYLRRGRGYLGTAARLRLEAVRRSTRPRRLPPLQPVTPADPGRIAIRPLVEDDIPLVAGLHHRLLHETLNSRLGIPFLERLYGALLADPAARGWVALGDGHYLAFVSATLDLAATQARAQRAVPWREKFIALLHILTRPRDLGDFVSHQLLLFYMRLRFGRRIATILTLGVSPTMWGTGLAARLIEEPHRFFAQSGVRRSFVDTLAHNERAARFYEKSGYARAGAIAGNVVFRRET